MLNKFETSIPKDVHLYILIPTFSCYGCIEQSLYHLYQLLNEQDKPRITIICSLTWKEKEIEKFNHKAVIYYDVRNYLDYLHMNIANLTIIRTNKYQIDQIYTTNTENINQVINKSLIKHIRY